MWSVSEKTVLITGATSGIGLETAKALASAGARLVCTYRNKSRAESARDNILKCAPAAPVEMMECDLSSMASVRKFAADFSSRYSSLHVLINNAGIWETSYMKSADGFEMNFAVNHLGPFLLTGLLLDKLLQSKPSRIINVSSSSHFRASLPLLEQTRSSFSSAMAYSSSKLAQILFAKELSERLAGKGVTVNSLHPGLVNTGIFRHMNPVPVFFLKWNMISPRKGAATPVYLSVSDAVSQVSGAYFYRKKQVPPSAAVHDPNLRESLWKYSCECTHLNI